MNAAAINVGPLGRGLTAELARVRLAIVLRQVARSACLCIIWASVGGLLATALFFLMPWVLFGSQGTLALPTTIGLSMAGAMAGCWRSLRGWNWPSSTDCALALDFGRQPRDDALATILALPASHHFSGLILARAQAQIGHSGDLRLPPAVSTANFVAAPLLGLAAIVSVLFAMQLDPRGVELAEQAAPTQQSRTAANAGTSSSSAAELKAFEEALGLRKMQSSMEGLAADLRDEGKTQEARQASLDNARLASGKAVPVEGGGLELPAVVPSTAAAREELARRVEAAGAGAGRSALSRERGEVSASVDSGGGVKPDSGAAARVMKPFPAYDARRFDDPSQALADQSPERKALAQGAIDALSRISRGE